MDGWTSLFPSQRYKKAFINIDDFLVCVNGGNDFYLRRGGIKNAIAEIKLQFYLFK